MLSFTEFTRRRRRFSVVSSLLMAVTRIPFCGGYYCGTWLWRIILHIRFLSMVDTCCAGKQGTPAYFSISVFHRTLLVIPEYSSVSVPQKYLRLKMVLNMPTTSFVLLSYILFCTPWRTIPVSVRSPFLGKGDALCSVETEDYWRYENYWL